MSRSFFVRRWPNASTSSGLVARAVSSSELVRYRRCSEARYRCGKATLIFVHAHKGGGTTFVTMARGNEAGLARRERNGDPVSGSTREEWWRLPARSQARWFLRLRKDDNVRFVATEKGFPPPSQLLAPVNLVYAVVVREPVGRFVSYYFWRWRDKSNVVGNYLRSAFFSEDKIARLAPKAPTFADFVDSEAPLDGYYVRRFNGIENATHTVNSQDLHSAKRILSDVFSLVLITERLQDFQPLVEQVLGWPQNEFNAFYRKANPKPDLQRLEAWRQDWRQEITRRMPLDSAFYAHATQVAEKRLSDLVDQNNDGSSPPPKTTTSATTPGFE